MSNFVSQSSPRRSSASKKRQQEMLIFLQGVLISFVCACLGGSVLFLSGFDPFIFPPNLTATAMAERQARCAALIERAIQASGSYCGNTGSNNVCYGNTTIQAELAQDATRRFSERGDVITVTELRRLSAAPLNLESNEWGIAVFKIIANLPRSLPGETITMLVFGNTTLDNQGGNLESFYFYSELGQLACEEVPFDGLMINSPDGGGIRINVNGAELTLMGTASLKAVRNGEMEVSLLGGSGRVVANGQEQYFGAGQKVRVGLGGDDGVQATTGPSEPEPLTQAELDTACTMTGQFCSQADVTPVSAVEAEQQLGNEITFTPTTIFTQTSTRTPLPSFTPTGTPFVLPSWTPSRGPTATRTLAPIRTPTRTRAPGPTRTRTSTPSVTPTRTNTPTSTLTASLTSTFTATSTATATFTPTDTPTFTPTAVAPTEPFCGQVALSPLTTPNPNELTMDITNNSGGPITINRFFAYWVELPTSQKLDRLFLNSIEIWDISDTRSPSDIPTESNWKGPAADRLIPDPTPLTLLARFQDPLQSGNYQIHIVFDIGCQVTGSLSIP